MGGGAWTTRAFVDSAATSGYTNGNIAAPGGKYEDILYPAFVDNIYVSDQKDEMEVLK